MAAETSITNILRSAALKPERTKELEKYRRNLTILFTDIKGSTAYFERFGDAAGLLMVDCCNSLVSSIVERHSGRVVKTIGDSVMAAFEDNVRAVAAAVEMQEALAQENVSKPEAQRVFIRIGVNDGTGIVKSGDVFGDVVNVASRVESVARPNQIVVSDGLRHSIPGTAGFKFRLLGRFVLRGKTETQELFEVVWNEDAAALPPSAHTLVSADAKFARADLKLQRFHNDGTVGAEHDLKRYPFVIGRTEGDLVFNGDEKLHPRHAALSLEDGQLVLNPIDDASVFFSLVGPYRLQDGDVIRMGHHQFEFRANMTLLATAAATGTTISDLANAAEAAPVEFVSLDTDGERYPVTEEQVTWGRSKATYVFPDDMLMSRAHAKVYHRGEDFFLEDAGSRNGTFVKAGPHTPLVATSILSLGGQLLRVIRNEIVAD